MVEAKKAKWYQVALMELGRYTALAGTVLAGTGLPGCCSTYKPLDKDIVKQKYLHEEPFNYAAKADCECNELWKKGKIVEALVTRLGWGVRVVNGAGAAASAGGLGLVAGEDGENFARYAWDGTYGGRTFDEAVSELFRLDLEGFFEVVDMAEDSGLGGTGKATIIGVSIAAPIVIPLTICTGKGNGAVAPVGPGSTPVDPF